MKKLVVLVFVATLLLNSGNSAFAASKEKLTVYTSMKEVLIGKLRDAFVKKYPAVDFDYYSAGAGKLMAKIAAERQSGKIAADVLWTSEIPDFYQLKSQGMLDKYISPEAKNIVSPVKDPAGYFTPARLGTLGIVYNTKKITVPPKSWQDLLDKRFKDGFGIANPALSGTAMVSIAQIINNLGWDYIDKLKANGAKMGQGSGQVVDDTASGDLKAAIGVDYIVIEKMEKGANLGFMYPKEMLVIPSPVAIIKGSANVSAARKFVDFLLSKEGQEIIASSGTLPIREDVAVVKKFGLVTPREATARSMKIDYQKMIDEKESIIKKFSDIMRAK